MTSCHWLAMMTLPRVCSINDITVCLAPVSMTPPPFCRLYHWCHHHLYGNDSNNINTCQSVCRAVLMSLRVWHCWHYHELVSSSDNIFASLCLALLHIQVSVSNVDKISIGLSSSVNVLMPLCLALMASSLFCVMQLQNRQVLAF